MNEVFVLIAIGVVVAAFVLRPLLTGRRPRPARSDAPASPPPPAPPVSSDELAELELDRAMGRISEADYQRWRAELEVAAPPAAGEPAVVVIAQPADATARAEALVRQWRDAPRPSCATCGERPEPGARYCSNCGAALAPDA